MDFLEKIFKGDKEKIARAEQLFDRILLSGRKGSSDDKLEVRKLVDMAKSRYALRERISKDPAEFVSYFHPRHLAAMKQAEIFMEDSVFIEAMRAEKGVDVLSNLAAYALFIAALGIHESDRHPRQPLHTGLIGSKRTH